MPSQVVAGPRGLEDEVAESTASLTHNKEDIPLPVLQEVEVVYDIDYVLDCQGRQRFDREANDQHYYIGQPEDPSPSYLDFPMPGQVSADTLRDFLRQNLRPDQVVDEYGTQCDITAVSNDHLLTLQAKLWVKIPGSRSLVKPTTQRPSRSQNPIAGHVLKISQRLKEKHVFILNEDSKNRGCDYISDLQTTTEHACHSRVVKLEPLVHWGTVVRADSQQHILAFRRKGELMRSMDKPEFKLYVRQVVDSDAPSYCIDCLGYLWSKRGEAQGTIRQLQDSVSRPQYRFSEKNPIPRPVLKSKSFDSRSTGTGTLAVGGTSSSTATCIDVGTDELDQPLDRVLPQLDGACDCLDNSGTGRGNAQDETTIWLSSDSDKPIEKLTAVKRPLQRTDPSALPLHTPPDSSGYAVSSAPPTRPSALTTANPSNARGKKNTSDRPAKGFAGTQIIDLTTPPRTKERKFGQELDPNTKAAPVEVRRSPRKHKTNMFMSQAIRSAPVKPMKSLRCVQKTKAAPKSTEESKKRKNAFAGEQKTKQKKTRKTDTKVSLPPVHMDNLATRPRLGLSSPERLQQAIRLAPTARAASPPKLTVHFAKPPAESELPDNVADEEWAAFRRTHPTPTSKICFCNKPACHGKFKKGEEPQIAQCASKDCRFRWFHYACLDLSEKGKARWGTLLCSICRVEHELAERDRNHGWTAGKMTNFPPLWTKEDIGEQLPGSGGVITQANPYGLGSDVQLEPMYKRQIKETGTLGGLQKLGYPRSRPEMLEEAYPHAGAYAELLARRAEEDQDVEWDDGIYGEEGEDAGEDVYDEETDEEL